MARPISGAQPVSDPRVPLEEWDDDWDYDLMLWIKTTMSLDDLETSIANLIQPVQVSNHQFDVGGVRCKFVTPADHAPEFPGVPTHVYRHAVIIPTTIGGIWQWIDKEFAIGLAIYLRGFDLTWMLVADNCMFVAAWERGSPVLVNQHYSDREFGRYARLLGNTEPLGIDIPPL